VKVILSGLRDRCEGRDESAGENDPKREEQRDASPVDRAGMLKG
jgi:hypothetical protein